jgi:hypothetical protein
MPTPKPLPPALLNYLEPVKPFIDKEPIEKKTIIDRCAGRVEMHVLNFLKMFSFHKIQKLETGELIIV